MLEYISLSPDNTYRLAQKIGRKLRGGELIALEGELGAGKTLFVKGLASGLGVKETVTSPTFALIHIYEGRLTLAHFDAYRLPCPQALEELGYEEFFYGNNVTAVEWSDVIDAYLPNEYLHVLIKREIDSQKGEIRSITLVPHGQAMTLLVEELKENDRPGN